MQHFSTDTWYSAVNQSNINLEVLQIGLLEKIQHLQLFSIWTGSFSFKETHSHAIKIAACKMLTKTRSAVKPNKTIMYILFEMGTKHDKWLSNNT